MLKGLDRREVFALALIVLIVAALASVTSYALATKASAANSTDTGRYELSNSADTKIVTIKVRDASCLDYEDSAATLKVTRNGYEPSQGTVTYRCINP